MDAKSGIIVTDANVIINLIHASRLDICGKLPGIELIVPDHVRDEVSVAAQRVRLDSAISDGVLKLAAIKELTDIAILSQLTAFLGRGEAACLVLAARHGWTIASDELGRFRREVMERLGPGRLVGTVDLYLLLIRAGSLTVDEADADKMILERHRFKMPFVSFRDLVARPEGGHDG